MNTALRVLIILILIMNGVALWFALELFGKRDLLVNRADFLEKTIVRLAGTIESADPVAPTPLPQMTPKDIGAVRDMILETPDTDDFWDNYKFEFESTGTPIKYTSDDVQKWREIYKPDGNGKGGVAINPNGTKVDGQAHEIADALFSRANAQLTLLNRIRAELTATRDKLEETIIELNTEKKNHRVSKKEITDQKNKIAELESTISELNRKVEGLEAKITELSSEIASKNDEIDKLNEDLASKEEEIAELKTLIDKLMADTQSGTKRMALNITAGVKGSVVEVDNEKLFVVIKVSDSTLDELIGPERDKELPETEFWIGSSEADITNKTPASKIRLRSIMKGGNLLTCDMPFEWKQRDAKVGDVVFYP